MSPEISKPLRVTVVGHVTHDLYDGNVVLGGCAYYGGRVYQGLDARVRLLSSWGRDFQSNGAVQQFDETLVVAASETTTFENRYRPDATRVQWLGGQAARLLPDAFAPGDADIVHLAPVLDEVPLETWAPAMRTLRDSGRVRWVALAVQGFARAKRPVQAGHEIDHVRWDPDWGILSAVDVAFLSDEDTAAHPELVDRLRASVPCVVLTHGECGAEVFRRDQPVCTVGTYATRAVDPTGAGDTFAAAFMVALARGHSDADAACQAAAAASIVIEAQGAAALDRLHEVDRRAEQVRVG